MPCAGQGQCQAGSLHLNEKQIPLPVWSYFHETQFSRQLGGKTFLDGPHVKEKRKCSRGGGQMNSAFSE